MRFKRVIIFSALVAIVVIGGILALYNFIPPGDVGDSTPSLELRKDANELEMHLVRYYDKYGIYPTEEQGIMALVEKPTVGKIPKDYKPVINHKRAVLDPWGTPYILKVVNREFQIFTLGADKKEGGEGKNSDFNIMKEDEYPDVFKSKKRE